MRNEKWKICFFGLNTNKKGNGSHPFPFTLIAEPFAGHVLMIRAQRKILHFSFQISHLSLPEDTAVRVEMTPENRMAPRLEPGQATLPYLDTLNKFDRWEVESRSLQQWPNEK
jgi:hypothetical protein